MKKIFIYSIAILAALAAASCSMENFSEQPVSEAVNAIELGVRCSASPVARTIMGNDTYNENTIHHIDYYIYNVDPGSYTATPSLKAGSPTPRASSQSMKRWLRQTPGASYLTTTPLFHGQPG